MAEIRLSKLTRQFNIGLQTLVDFLKEKGAEVEMNPNAKISDSYLPAIEAKFGDEQKLKQDSEKVAIKLKEIIEGARKKTPEDDADANVKEVIIKSNLSSESTSGQTVQPAPAREPDRQETPAAETAIPAKEAEAASPAEPAGGLKIVGEIDLSQFKNKPKTKEPATVENTASTASDALERMTAGQETASAQETAAKTDETRETHEETKGEPEPAKPQHEVREIKIEVEKLQGPLQGPKIEDKKDMSQFDSKKKNKKR